MIQTQEQWYEKLKSWVPSWVFENEQYQVAVFHALAKVFATAEQELNEIFENTFISASSDYMLDHHGGERNILRLNNEDDFQYSNRIRFFKNLLDGPSLEALASSYLLNDGVAKLYEPENVGFFCDRGTFLGRNDIVMDLAGECEFIIVIPNQGPSPEATANIHAMVAAINRSKALGTVYRLVELL